MKIAVLAVHRLGRAPEAALTADWLDRASAAGRRLGLGPFELIEVEGKRAEPDAEAAALLGRLEPGDRLVICDERGRSRPSRDFAAELAARRDEGVRRMVFAVGGASGLHASVRACSHDALGFGVQTWPHALVRAMLAEQLYRAATILGGSPYHKD